MMKVMVRPRRKSLARDGTDRKSPASEYCPVHANRPRRRRRAEQGNQAVRHFDLLKQIFQPPCCLGTPLWVRAMFLSEVQCIALARFGLLPRQTLDFRELVGKTLAPSAPAISRGRRAPWL